MELKAALAQLQMKDHLKDKESALNKEFERIEKLANQNMFQSDFKCPYDMSKPLLP